MKIHRKEIAKAQLQTAISLFLNRIDLSSAITLAGAASNILTQLVRNEGKTPFIDFAREVYEHTNKGKKPPKEKYSHYIDRLLGVSAHKHMDNKCPRTISLDLEKCAPYAITRAVADYVILYGEEENFIKAFLHWSWKHQKDEVMEACKDMPEKFKKQLRKVDDRKNS
jgi:hypothetical protein